MVLNVDNSLSGVKRSCILQELMDEGAEFRTSSFHSSHIPSPSFDYPFGSAQDTYGGEFRKLPERSRRDWLSPSEDICRKLSMH